MAPDDADVVSPVSLLRRDWRVHIGLDLRLREGTGVDPHLVDSPAEEVVIRGSHGPRAGGEFQ